MCILLSERIQSEKVSHCMHVHLFTVCVHLYDNLEKAKLYRKLKKKKKTVVSRDYGGERDK